MGGIAKFKKFQKKFDRTFDVLWKEQFEDRFKTISRSLFSEGLASDLDHIHCRDLEIRALSVCRKLDEFDQQFSDVFKGELLDIIREAKDISRENEERKRLK